MYFNLVFDRFQSNRPYPNLAPWVDITQGYSKLWATEPYVIPIRLLYYVDNHDYPTRYFLSSDNFPSNSWYPIAIAFYNFGIDYFSLIPTQVKKLLQDKKLKILFYYHEGDNPKRQLEDLDQKWQQCSTTSSTICVFSRSRDVLLESQQTTRSTTN